MNTSDMHPFIHPLSAAVDPAWESKSDWEIYKGIAKKFSEVCVGHLGKETDVVTLPIQHDSAAEMAQPLDVKDWKKANAISSPGKPRRILFRLSVITRRPTKAFHLDRPAAGNHRQRRERHRLEHPERDGSAA